MSGKQCVVRLLALAGIIGLLLTSSSRIHRRLSVHAASLKDSKHMWPSRVVRGIGATLPQFSLPVVFAPNAGQARSGVQYAGSGKGLAILLSRKGIAVSVPGGRKNAGPLGKFVRFRLRQVSGEATAGVRSPGLSHSRARNRNAKFAWRGKERLRGEGNYFIGNDRRRWRTHVPFFAQAQAENALPGVSVAVYGGREGVEYDLRLAPGADPSELRLDFSGAERISVAGNGDLVLRVGGGEMRMRKPDIYQEPIMREPAAALTHGAGFGRAAWPVRKRVEGSYEIKKDGSVGFCVGQYDSDAALVIDPSISVTYESFLGGAGNEVANSVALDSSGNIYIGGTTTAPATFSEAGSKTIGPGIGTSGSLAEYFIAKIDPHASGASSLIYLTFLGGSDNQTGGLLAVDASGDVAITGTTSSPDFPVTDGSTLTTGPNDATVSEIDPTGGNLLFSSIFGGNGTESQYRTGGIAVDSAGNIYIASDTTSSNLPATSGAFQTTLGGSADGFLAVFQPGKVPSLAYCSYLGTNANAQVGVGGIALDAAGSVYIAGFSSNAGSGFPAKNAFQTAYGGDPTDAFLMKVLPAGQGASDVIYATLMGGSGEDEALAVAVDGSNPPIAYVTGTTQSPDFPANGTTAAFQPNLHLNATANAFLAAVVQNPGTGMTSLAYSTYFGGSATDAGQGVAVAALNAVYVAGTTNSWDFPWRDNLQPFNGSGDAFVAKFDPTSAGISSLIYATPLGGTALPGASANAGASSIAADRSGDVYVAGQTTAPDFPSAISTAGVMNGFQSVCASCQESPALADAFLVALQESASRKPSVYFNIGSVAFPPQPVGTPNAPQLVALHNGGETTLNIATLAITGASSSDFSLIGGAACQGQAIPPAGECSFEVNFVPSIAGPEGAVVSVTDDAPGSPQLLELAGQGQGPFASLSATSLNFGSQPENTTSLGQTITITNTGNQALAMASPTETGTGVAQFSLSGADTTCGASLPPGQSCAIGVLFEPKAIGSFTAEVDINDDSGGVSNAVQAVTVSGTGTAAAPIAIVFPGSLVFGSIEVGSDSGTQAVTLSNSGSAPMNVASIGIMGANATDFKVIASGSNACPLNGGSLAAGAGCTMNVQFSPQAGDSSGNKSASLGIADNASGSPQTVSLSGVATSPPAIQILPGSLNFSPQSAGTASPGQTLAISNTSSASSLSVSGIGVGGANAANFTETNNCPPSLGPGSHCTVNVTFNPVPGTVAARSAAIDITDNAPGSPQVVPLSGTATLAGISMSPANLGFGGQQAGTASPPETITVTNDGTGALAFTSIAVTGADFTIGANTCKTENTPPGGSCTIQMVFRPACTNGSAARSATLVLNDNVPGSPQSIPLGGTATGDFCFDPPAAGVTSATVTPGETAAYTLVVNSPAGYTGSVSLSCSGAPPESACTVPASITVPSQFAVSVPTTANSTMSLAAKRPLTGPPPARSLFLATVFALFMWIAAWGIGRRCQARPSGACPAGLTRFVRTAALLSTFALGMAACSSASGGGASGAGTPGTPAGTYVLTVAGSTATTSAKIALNLTVN